MKMIDHNHFICHLILGTFTEYPEEYILFLCDLIRTNDNQSSSRSISIKLYFKSNFNSQKLDNLTSYS